MSVDYDVVIIGAGVVGLAVAYKLSQQNLSQSHPRLLIVERNTTFGEEASSRNSEVIHAGIYYEPDSLKAMTCIRGRTLLYELLEKYSLPYRRTGKLIVATNATDDARLPDLLQRGHDNGVEYLEIIDKAQVQKLVPGVRALSALWSPSTGILDVHSLMQFFAVQASSNGADIVYGTTFEQGERLGNDYRLRIRDVDGDSVDISAHTIVNAAGLSSDEVAAGFGIDPDESGYRIHYSKGCYFQYSGPELDMQHLVYPVPALGDTHLGIHSVIDLAGQIRFGPNASFLGNRELDYSVSGLKRHEFGESIRHYLPCISDEHLHEGFAGIRPKLSGPGQPARDFIISDEAPRDLPGLINLIGIESPGLTASLAIAALVEELLRPYF